MTDETPTTSGSNESQVFAATSRPAPPPVEVMESSAASDVMEEIPSFVARGLVYLLAVLVVTAALYAYFGKTDDVIKGQGALVPQGEAAIVQSGKPGRLAAIRVKEGDVVREGQVLAELDLTPGRLERVKSQPERIRLQREHECAREAVELMRGAVVDNKVRIDEKRLTNSCSADEADAIVALKRAQADYETAVWQAENVHGATLQSLVASFKGKRETIALKKAQLADAERDRERAKTQLDTYREMVRRGLASNVRFLEEQKKYEEAIAKVKDAEVNVHAAEAELEEAESRAQSNKASIGVGLQRAKEAYDHALLRHQAAVKAMEKRLYQFDLQLTQLNAETKFQDFMGQFDRMVAPVSGTVTAVKLRTVGEMVRAGETVFTINPAGRPLVARVAIPNRSIGQVKVGMPAKLKFDAFPFQNYGIVPGRVLEIAPDARQTKDDLVFDTTLSVDKDHVVKAGKRTALFPGLSVAAEIVVERRRIIDVFLDPFKKLTED